MAPHADRPAAPAGPVHVGRPARGRLRLPGGKGHAIRAAFLAAQASGASVLEGCPEADDLDRCFAWLRAGGVAVERSGGDARIVGLGGAPEIAGTLDAGDAGAVLRMGLFWAASGSGSARVIGSPQLARRPVAEGIRWLRALGAGIRGEGIPFELEARGLPGGTQGVAPADTSQFVSGCLLSAPLQREPLVLEVARGPMPSEVYVERTLEALAEFGVPVGRSEASGLRRITVARELPQPRRVAVRSDPSARLVFACVAAVLGGRVVIEESGPRFDPGLRALEAAGVGIEVRDGSLVVTGPVRGAIELDADDDPDAAPPLAVVALFAPGTSRIRGAGRLRHKESDRGAALVEAARALGGDAELEAARHGGTLSIRGGGGLRGARLATGGDHRMAFALSLAALRVPGVELDDVRCVAKSDAGFFERLRKAVG